MSSAGRGDARPSNKAGGGGRGSGGGGGSHSSKKESILELAKASSAPFVVRPSIGGLAHAIVPVMHTCRRCHRQVSPRS
jgi:hypothetical protein